MKLFSKLSILALAGCFMVACTEEEVYQPGEWDAAVEGFQNVSFQEATQSIELDPAEDTKAFIEVLRTDTTEAIEVSFNVLENTDDVFIVGKCEFAKGDTLAKIPVEFPTAKEGITYTLQLELTDPKFVSSYTTDNTITFKVTRVKWNSLGKGTIEEWGFLGGVGEIEFFQREDDHKKFRVYQPFHNIMIQASDGNYYPFSNFNIFSPDAAEYLTFEVIPTLEESEEKFLGEYEVEKEGLIFFDAANMGYYNSSYAADINILHPLNLKDYQDPSTWEYNRVLSWQKESETNLPGQVQLAPYYYMYGVGGWDYTTEDGMVILTFPGYKEPVSVDVRQDVMYDEEVFTGTFTSSQMGTKGAATLYKETEVTLEDEEAVNIYKTNFGTAYAIAGTYSEDCVIYFCVDNDGNVRAPEFATEDGGITKLQSLGIKALGQDVYAKINEGKSTFTDELITLNITFTNADGSVEYGTTDETLSNVPYIENPYTTVGTADYTYTILFVNEDGSPYLDEGLELQQSIVDPTEFQVLNWGMGSTFTFYWDQTTNRIDVPMQPAYTYNGSVVYYIADIPTAVGNPGYYEQFPSAYDPETGVATLYVYYFDANGQGAYDAETMKINLNAVAEARANKSAISVKSLTSQKGLRAKTPWSNPKKVNKLERFGKPVWLDFAK